MVTMTTGGPTSPAKAAMLPGTPRKRDPNTTLRLTMLGPGRKWHSAKVSLNSSAVIQRCCSTMPRRAQTKTPPKPASDILANARNSSARPGWMGGCEAEISGAGTASGRESGGMRQDLKEPQGGGQCKIGACRVAERGGQWLCFSQLLHPILGVPVRRLWK